MRVFERRLILQMNLPELSVVTLAGSPQSLPEFSVFNTVILT
jgi:hypothetical protein